MADSIEETDVAVVGAGGGGAVLALLPPGFSPIYVRMRNLHIRCLREEYGDG